MSDLLRVVNHYVGSPWSRERDCWGFVRQVYAEVYCIGLPELPGVDAADARSAARAAEQICDGLDWLPVPAPADGDCVLMGKRAGRAHHCGIWLAVDGGRIAHCDQVGGVCCHSVAQVRAIGFGDLDYFRHRNRAP